MGINYNGLITKKLAWREKCTKNGTKIDDNLFCGPHVWRSSKSSYRSIRIKLSIYGTFDHIYQDMTTVNDFSGIGAGNRTLVFMCALEASKSMRVRSFMMDNLVVICLIYFHNGLALIDFLSCHCSCDKRNFTCAILINFLPLYSSGHSLHDNILYTATKFN